MFGGVSDSSSLHRCSPPEPLPSSRPVSPSVSSLFSPFVPGTAASTASFLEIPFASTSNVRNYSRLMDRSYLPSHDSEMAQTMSELLISSPRRPKVRRRLRSTDVTTLEDQFSRHSISDDGGPRKPRKLPLRRRTSPQMKVALHEDLKNYRGSSTLPDCLFSRYRRSTTGTAVMVYAPPLSIPDIISSASNRQRKESSVSPPKITSSEAPLSSIYDESMDEEPTIRRRRRNSAPEFAELPGSFDEDAISEMGEGMMVDV